jgi:hypothetical protein
MMKNLVGLPAAGTVAQSEGSKEIVDGRHKAGQDDQRGK